MFEFISKSLGKLKLIKSEDAGEVSTKDVAVKLPDFHLILHDGTSFFVEVKNYYQGNPMKRFEIPQKELDGLVNYSQLLSKDVKVSIYWSKWNIWTLLPAGKFTKDKKKYYIDFFDAIKSNEMAILGDFTIATTPPLEFKIKTDESKPRKILDNGSVEFTIAEIEFYCGHKLIKDKSEQQIAFALMYNGDWVTAEPTAEVVNKELISISYIAEPQETTPDQKFESIGSLSSMISRQFKWLTAPEGTIENISLSMEESSLGRLIPPDYKGKDLPLWCFIMQAS